MSYQLLGVKNASVSEETHYPSSGIWKKIMYSVNKIISRKENKIIKHIENDQIPIPTQLRSYNFESSGSSRRNKLISTIVKNRYVHSAQIVSNSVSNSKGSNSNTEEFIIMTSITGNLPEIDGPNKDNKVAVPLYEQILPSFQSHVDEELPPDLHVKAHHAPKEAKYTSTELDDVQESAPLLFRKFEDQGCISVVDAGFDVGKNEPSNEGMKQRSCALQNQIKTSLYQHAHAPPHLNFDTCSATAVSNSEQFSIHAGDKLASSGANITQLLSNIALFCFVLGIVCAYMGTRLIAWYDSWNKERMPRYLAKLEKKTIDLLKLEHFAQVKTLLQKELPSVVRYRGESHSDTAAFRHFLGKALLALGEASAAEVQLRKVVDCYVGFGEDLYMAHALEDLGIAQQTQGVDMAVPALDTMRRALRIFTEEANAAEAATRSRNSVCLFQSPDTCSPCSSVSNRKRNTGSLRDSSASDLLQFPSSSSTPSTLSIRRSPNSIRSSISSPPDDRKRSNSAVSSDALTLEFLSGDTGSIDTEGTVLEWYTPGKHALAVSTAFPVGVESPVICRNNKHISNSSMHGTDLAVEYPEPVQDGRELRKALEELERLLLEPSAATEAPSAAENLLNADSWLPDSSTQLFNSNIPSIGGDISPACAPCTPSRRIGSNRERYCMRTPIDCPQCPHVARVLHRAATLLSRLHRYDETVEYLLCASEVYTSLYGASCSQMVAVESDIETARAHLTHCKMKFDNEGAEGVKPSFDSPNMIACLEIDNTQIVPSPIKKKTVI